MTYETIDWDAEAKRIARAFGVTTQCTFEPCSVPFSKELYVEKQRFHDNRMNDENIELLVYYSQSERSFELIKPNLIFKGFVCMGVYVNWDGSMRHIELNESMSNLMAKGLFHLDLLTPEVETALEVRVSAHEKLEWQLEYQARTEATE